MALAARGEFDAAREFYAGLRQPNLERGMALIGSTLAEESGTVELRAHEWDAAERIFREAWDSLAATGEQGFRSTQGASLAMALVQQRRLDEAAAIVDECEQMTSADDFATHAAWRSFEPGSPRRGASTPTQSPTREPRSSFSLRPTTWR